MVVYTDSERTLGAQTASEPVARSQFNLSCTCNTSLATNPRENLVTLFLRLLSLVLLPQVRRPVERREDAWAWREN